MVADTPFPRGSTSFGLSSAIPAASSASRAACHRAMNSLVSPCSSSTTSSRKPHFGTRGPRNMLWMVDELMTPRPIPLEISRIEGWPAAR